MTHDQLRQAERAQSFELWMRHNGYKAVVSSDYSADEPPMLRVRCEWVCPECGYMETDELAKEDRKSVV